MSVDEALYFSNNDRVQRDLLGKGGKLVGHLLKLEDRDARLETAYLNTLSRKPTADEVKFLATISRCPQGQRGRRLAAGGVVADDLRGNAI